MSNIIRFCFTLVCVNLPSNPSHEMVISTMELYYLGRSFKSMNDKLNCFENNFQLINEQKVKDVQNNALNDAINEHAGPALKAVRDAVEAARDNGSDFSHCYTIARRIIDDAIRNSYEFDIVPCIANFTHAVQKIRQKVEPIREDIKRTQHYFKKTVPSCYNSTRAFECFTTAVRTIEEAQEHSKKLIDRLINEEETSYPRLQNDFKTCRITIWTKIENAASFVQREGIRCAETTGTFIHDSTYRTGTT